jgi:chitodextrinase
MVRHALTSLSRPKQQTHELSALDRTPPPSRLEDKLPVSGYRIKVLTASAPTRLLTTDAAAAEATVDALLSDTEYTFQITAVNLSGVGDFSSASDPVTTSAGAWHLSRWIVVPADISRLLPKPR